MSDVTVKRCDCGGQPSGMSAQVAEDAVEAWIECGFCGAKTGSVEDAYADWATAAMFWNRGERVP